ncbi:tripartite tricarboxylate transporter TctB family protein [Pectobacterium versatile]|uniref:tripartite tricarboxylate transporter TctB family protein n=1 Tax=Pectobacterium versatile TaxID=2488639 RepID=UPI001F291C2A|nr:tripartite tricarboxylate transporter TctB family protein [Pectobacterium versatile]MCO4312411.1 tripartite tricarboxylate transporter TctB family protein [Pectobacterium versatile]
MALTLNPTRHHTELIFAALWVVIASGMFIEAGKYTSTSAAFPRALAVLLAVSGLTLIIKACWHRPKEEGTLIRLLHAPLRVIMGFAMVTAYILLTNHVGYIAASLLFGITLPLLAGYRQWWRILATVGATIVFIIVVFRILLARQLPEGVFEMWLENIL